MGMRNGRIWYRRWFGREMGMAAEARRLRVDEVRDEVYAELVAGYITPASVIGWCLWHLNRSPGVPAAAGGGS